MHTSFFVDYEVCIVRETRVYRNGYVEYRVHANDVDGEVLVGCKGPDEYKAYKELVEFVESECKRRGV